MNDEFEVIGGQILHLGRAVANLIPGLPNIVEQDLVSALCCDVEEEIDEACAEARSEAFRAVARNDEEALEEVDMWRSVYKKMAAEAKPPAP